MDYKVVPKDKLACVWTDEASEEELEFEGLLEKKSLLSLFLKSFLLFLLFISISSFLVW